MKNKRIYKKLLAFILCFTIFASSIAGVIMADYHEITNDSLVNPTLFSSIYANSTYVAVGEGGAIYTSTDSTDWTKQEIVTNEDLKDITYGDNEFVAVGENGTILTSENAIDWSEITNADITASLNAVIYNNQTYIAVGSDGIILTASANDTTEWSQQTVTDTPDLNDIIFAKNAYYAVGSNGIVITSANLITWSVLTTNTTENLYTISTNEGGTVTQSNSILVVGGENGSLVVSYNGNSWSVQSAVISDAVTDISFANGMFLLAGLNSAVLTSSDGINWSAKYSPVASDWYSIEYLNSKYFCFGSECLAINSTDAATWATQYIGNIPNLKDIAFLNGKFIAVGETGTIITSTDNKNWNKQSFNNNFDINSITYGLDKYVVVGESGNIFTSSDSIAWARASWRDTTVDINDICFANNTFVAVGTEGLILTSTDGNNWSQQTSPIGYDLNAVIGYGTVFVAVGDLGTILYSEDSINWSSVGTIGNNLNDVNYIDGNFVIAGASGTVKYSADATTWTTATVDLNKNLTAICPEKKIIASKSGEIAGATSLTEWNNVLNSNSNINAIAYGLNTFVAVGDDIISFIADITAPTLTLTQQSEYTNGNVTVTISVEDESEIVTQKWASGSQTADYFSSNGTEFSGNSFEVSENGVYTVFVKDKGDLATVKQITVNKKDTTAPTAPNWAQHYASANNHTQIIWGPSTDNGSLQGYLIYKNNLLIGTVASHIKIFIDETAYSSTDTYSVVAIDTAGNTSSAVNSTLYNAMLVDGFYEEITVQNLKSNITLSATETVTVTDIDGNTLAETAYVGSGTHIIIKNNDTVTEEYIVLIYGDVTYDGLVNSDDVDKIRDNFMEDFIGITNIEELLSDANADEILDARDVTALKKFVSNHTTVVNQNRLNYIPSRLSNVIDNQSPTVSLSASQIWNDTNTVSISATDTKSGIIYKAWKYGEDGTYTTLTEETFEVDKNGVYTVLVRDFCGNETVTTVTVNHIIEGAAYGGYEQSFEDLFVESKGPDFALTRYYSSFNEESGLFGKGWLSTYEMTCKDYNNDPTLNLKVVTVPGEASYLFALDNGVYTSGMTRMTLTQNTNGTFTLTDNDITYTFNSNGFLTSIKDTLGDQLTITVDENGKIQSITDCVERTYTFTYSDAHNYVAAVTDPMARTVEFIYNDNGLLLEVLNPLRTVKNKYSYNNDMNLTTVTDAFNNVIEQVEYISSENLISKYIDENGNELIYTYDDSNSTVTVTDVFDDQTVYTYNAYNQIIGESTSAGTTNTAYLNTYGDIDTVTDADGNTTKYTYNNFGDILTVTYTVDEDITTEEYTYDSNRNLLSEKDTEGKRKYYEYDDYGNVTTEITPINGTDIYDSATSDEADFEFVTHTYYDEDDEIYENGQVKKTTLADGEYIRYYYDNYGYTNEERHSENGTTEYSYNVIGWLINTEDDNGIITSYKYNNNGDVLRITEDDYVQMRTVYDSYGRILQQIEGIEYNSDYDGLNMSPSQDYYLNNWNEVEVGTRYYYGNTQKLSSVKMSCYTLNLDGKQNITNVSVGNNSLATYSYSQDAKNLLQSVNYANSQSVAYTYNDSGNITAMTVDGSTTPAFTYTYDESGELTGKTDLVNGIQTDYTDTAVTVSQINEDETLTQLHKYETVTESDIEQFVETVGENVYTVQRLDDIDRFVVNSTTNIDKSYTYNQSNALSGTVIQKSDSETAILSSTYSYLDSGKVSNMQNTYNGGSVAYAYTYTEDNITKIVRNNNEISYVYDNGDQLIRVNDASLGKTFTYTYNAATGNILSVNEYAYTTSSQISTSAVSTKTFAYEDSNWQDKLTSVNGNAITYDALGNPLTYNGYSYIWEAGRQLKQMTDGTNTYSYKYDDSGIRTEKTVNGVTTKYTTVGGKITSQTDTANTLYFRYDRNDSLTGFNLNGTEYFYLKSAMGDIEGILDTNGNLVVEYSYDAWGKILAVTGSMASTVGALNPMRYRDYYFDSETGYYYLQSRYYNPDICRFINADEPSIISMNYGSIIGANLFAYCNNNAVNNLDNTGYYTISSLRKKSWIFKLASAFGINLQLINKTVRKSVIRIDLYLVKLYIYVSVGLTRNYKAGISFNYSKNSVGVSLNTGLGKGYSIAYSYTLSWTNISRSMSLVYCSTNDGVYASIDVEFKINHLASAAVVAAAVYWPQISPVVAKMLIKSRTAAVSAMSLLTPILRWRYAI